MSEKALKLLIEAGLDGMNIDIKGDKKVVKLYCNAEVGKVWRNAKIAKEKGIKTLEEGIEIGKDVGLKYVYCGNVPGHKFENTYCPNCGTLLIKRYALSVLEYNISKDKRCPNCKKEIPIVGKYLGMFSS